MVGDMCMGSALHADGRPYPHAAAEDGKAIDRLTGQKHDKYPELVTSDRVHFVALASSLRAKKADGGARTCSR